MLTYLHDFLSVLKHRFTRRESTPNSQGYLSNTLTDGGTDNIRKFPLGNNPRERDSVRYGERGSSGGSPELHVTVERRSVRRVRDSRAR